MSRWGRLSQIVQIGALLMFVGNLLVALLRFNDANWKYFVFVFPANLGQGMVYPGILFSFLAAFDHTGKHCHKRIARPWLISRPRRLLVNCLPHSILG